MSAELQFQSDPILIDATIVAIVRDKFGRAAQQTTRTFVNYVDGDIDTYIIPMVMQGESSGYYTADFPLWITAVEQFPVVIFHVVGGDTDPTHYNPIGQGMIDWGGNQEVEPEGDEPLSVADAKANMGVASDMTDDDELIGSLITAAREYAESFCRRTFRSSVGLTESLDRFPRWGDGIITLPGCPVQVVTAIDYIDADGNPQVLGEALYTVDTNNDAECRIMPSPGNDWPATQSTLNAVTVYYQAGYARPPQSLIQALKLLVSYWYSNRDAAQMQSPTEIPFAVKTLLYSLKTFTDREFAGSHRHHRGW